MSAVFKPARREGYYLLGGRYKTVGGKELATGQMFVQFHASPEVIQPFPVVMVHGTTQSGVYILATPDGRRGWVDHFVERGFAVYDVDQVGHWAQRGHEVQRARPPHAAQGRLNGNGFKWFLAQVA